MSGDFELVHGTDGAVMVRIRLVGSPFLLRASLVSGFGSSAFRLDRGSPGKVRLAEFRRIGDRLILVERNKDFLATGDDASVRAGVESFVQSVIWSTTVQREEEDGAVIVDACSLAVADHHGVAEVLHQSGQGDYVVDEALSFPLLEQSQTSRAGIRLAAALTFRGPGQGQTVQTVAPDPRHLTLVQHLHLLSLPDPPMPARRYHPGSGGFGIGHADHGNAGLLGPEVSVRLQPRFRLDPLGDESPRRVRHPIVFYVDPAIPEPVRSAVVEGGNWWREGFERAGFVDAYRVEVLPADVDPHDPDVNMVWWVHRAERGWSMGAGLTDPRTGEIMTGCVRLGSQRVQQVRALAEALLAPYGRVDEAARRDAVEDVVLSRMRQLAAHEIGHALGFMHNYASTHHAKPSVMDYPHAQIRLLPDGTLDLSEAYSTGLGPWDLFLIAHAYGYFPGEDDEEALSRLRRDAAEAGLLFVSGDDGHPPYAAHVEGVQWVTMGDPIHALDEMVRIRRIALEGFSSAVLPTERQAGELEERATLLQLLHRHEVEAVARVLGGVRYVYVNVGEGGLGTVAVDGKIQQSALGRLAELLQAEQLALPDAVLETITPPGIGYKRTPEYLDTRSGRIFDPLSAAEAAAAVICQHPFEPTRLNRIAWQHELDPTVPGVADVVDSFLAATWRRKDPISSEVTAGEAVQQAANWVLLRYILASLDGDVLHPQVRAEIHQALRQLAADLRLEAATHPTSRLEAAEVITTYLANPELLRLDPLPTVPPGAPI